ncbi:MAG: rhodanese-like domain-containing protein [Chitinophagaceae bacterium]|nr:rhodanese-like domain-containing protein [Chitinophagaceae bacterium]
MKTLKEIVKDASATIVDVRSTWEYASDHIPGALNIPLEEISYRLAEFRQMKKPVVLYCRSGNRSGMAMSILRQNGLTEVYNGGGIEDMRYLLN